MRNRFRHLILILLVFGLAFSFFLPVFANNETVYTVKIDNTITKGLYQYLQRAIKTAEENGAEAIIFELDTPGGEVTAAEDIGNLIRNTELKTIAFINPDAISAGAYIALNTDEIYWAPNGRMGAAAIITQDGNAADEKAQSYWKTLMMEAAEHGERDVNIALAMIDKNIDLPEYQSPKGELLTLSATQAEQAGYADGIVANMDELLSNLGYNQVNIGEVPKTLLENVAEFVTNPMVVTLLLIIAFLGIVIELFSPGFGVPGIVGISALLLFYFGHFLAGLAGYETIILFILGIILLVAELFLPGGIVGFIGAACLFFSILLAGDNIVQMGISILIALGIAIGMMVILMKFFGKKVKIIDKLVLKDSTTTEQGYVSNENRTELLNKVGTALTPLRPSGTVVIDNERIDVVTEGGFVSAGAKVKVIKVEGVRVVVREITEDV